MSLKDKFKGQLTTGYTKTTTNIIKQQITSETATEVLILYIGGAGDKESYLGAGPYHNVVYLKEQIETALYNDVTVDIDRYYCGYLGYNEVYNNGQMNQIIKDYIYNKKNFQQDIITRPPQPIPRSELITRTEDEIKNLKIVIIGHSLGGWNGAHLAYHLTNNNHPLHYLITIDPVGLGVGVRTISKVNSSAEPRPQPLTAWINIRMIGSGFDNFIANMGARWIPGFQKPPFKDYERSSVPLPTYTYISLLSHASAWGGIERRVNLIKVVPSQSAPKDNEEKLSVLTANEQSPWQILKDSLLQWLKI